MELNNVYTALVTPFDARGEIDYKSLRKLVKYLYQKGIRGFLVAGTTGEAPTLRLEERIAMACFIKKIFPQTSIMVGVGSNDTTTTIQDIKILNEVQAIDAYLCVVPYYSRPSQAGIYMHFKAIDQVSVKPVIIYNVPKRCGVEIEQETLEHLIEDGKMIVGLKHASMHLAIIAELKKKYPEFIIYCGDDNRLLESLYQGADGVISVVSHVIPSAIISMVHEFQLSQNLEPLDDFIKMMSKYCFIEASPAPTKYLLSKMGLIENVLRLPLVSLSQENRRILDLLWESDSFR